LLSPVAIHVGAEIGVLGFAGKVANPGRRKDSLPVPVSLVKQQIHQPRVVAGTRQSISRGGPPVLAHSGWTDVIHPAYPDSIQHAAAEVEAGLYSGYGPEDQAQVIERHTGVRSSLGISGWISRVEVQRGADFPVGVLPDGEGSEIPVSPSRNGATSYIGLDLRNNPGYMREDMVEGDPGFSGIAQREPLGQPPGVV
jgi:hypothetical protein